MVSPHPPHSPARVRPAHVEHVLERLTARDREILLTVEKLRLVTGSQLQRLHFSDLHDRSASVVRWRVLKRLTDWRVLAPAERRIGGSLRGSGELAFALDSAGQRITQLLTNRSNDERRIRRPGVPSDQLLRRTLAVSELYVSLIEHTRSGGTVIQQFLAEPLAWLPDGLGGWLKPDAYVVLATKDYEDTWAVEVDLSTESVPTLRRKLLAYLDFYQRGQHAPNGVMPRVLVTVPTQQRQTAVRPMASQLPAPADKLFVISLDRDALLHLLGCQRE